LVAVGDPLTVDLTQAVVTPTRPPAGVPSASWSWPVVQQLHGFLDAPGEELIG
jgi:hypothetical protein